MSDAPNGGGERVSYTTKELLAEIREGIAVIKETTRDHGTRISRLENDVAGLDAIRKEYVPKVDALVRDLDIQAEVKQALDERSDRGFTRAEKLIGLVTAAALVVLQIASLIR